MTASNHSSLFKLSKSKRINNDADPKSRNSQFGPFLQSLLPEPGNEPWGLIAIGGVVVLLHMFIVSLKNCCTQKSDPNKSARELRLSWLEKNKDFKNLSPIEEEEEAQVYKMV